MKLPTFLFSAAALAVAVTGAQAASRVIVVTGDDTMKFSIAQIDAKPGEALEVVFTNAGTVPREAMAHNFVLLKPLSDDELAAFAASAAGKAPTFLPDDQSAVLAHTKTLGPKESDKVDFNAPSTPGEYPFICTFPGHYTLMHGKLIVK
jgi:azurin